VTNTVKIVTGKENVPDNHGDQGLAEELESLYCHVASLDRAESSGEQNEDCSSGSVSAPIPRETAPANIRQPDKKYEKSSTGNWYQHPLSQDKLAERLNEIINVYKDILTLWPNVSKHPPSSSAGADFSAMLSGGPTQEGIRDDRTSSDSRYSLLRRYRWTISCVATMIVIIIMFFGWPTLYHYDSLKIGNKIYPLRISRLTAHLDYFDGKAWLDSPIHADLPLQQTVNSQQFQEYSVITHSEIAALPLDVADPAKGKAEPPSPRRSEPLMKSMTFRSPIDSYPDTGNPPLPTSPQNPAKIAPDKGKGYSIQIKAFRDPHEARVFADDLKKKEPGIHIETALLEGRGVWYRILLGNFKTEKEALHYFTIKRTKDVYPGSFIKKSQEIP
jgi:cell division septation protein DedD